MDGIMHERISRAGLALLSGKSGRMWKDVEDILVEASNYPDIFWPGEASDAQWRSRVPDWAVYIKVPHKGGMASCHSLFDPLELRRTYPRVLAHYMRKTLSALRGGDMRSTARFAGVISHIIGDTGQVAHVVDGPLVVRLFPQGGRCYLAHTFMERRMRTEIPPPDHQPGVLGASVGVATWRLVEELQKLKTRQIGTLAPIMSALLKDDDTTACGYAAKAASDCACLLADTLNTLSILASERCVHAEKDLPLKELEPSSQFSDSMFNSLATVDRMPSEDFDWRKSQPLDIGNGPESGLAILPQMAPGNKVRIGHVEYMIHPGGFKTFRCRVGLNRNTVNDTGAIFEALLDGKPVWRSDVVTAFSEPISMDLPLGRARRLRLQVSDAREDATCTKLFHPVFIEPALVGTP